MIDYQDTLEALNKPLPLSEKLRYAHDVLNRRYDFIDRVSVAAYDPKTDVLSTFLDSSGDDRPLHNYEARLSDVPSLRHILETGQPRVVDDLSVFSASDKEHTRRIAVHGYRASYTLPMLLNGNFFGFVFFNSTREAPFTDESLHYLDVFGHLIALIVINELGNLRTLLAAVKTARDITHQRDFETGAHLDRMAHYSRIIARSLADRYGLDDEYIEQIFLFSPLHDIGKIGIPDNILLKQGKLTPEEYQVMKTHARRGREIIDGMLANFGLEGVHSIQLLRNIAQHHHEAIDGSGYPDGLANGAIPVEARIVAVADVFDALTSRRPYKEAWSNERAFETLDSLAGRVLDADCVAALRNNREAVEAIQAHFDESPYA